MPYPGALIIALFVRCRGYSEGRKTTCHAILATRPNAACAFPGDAPALPGPAHWEDS